MLPWVKGGIPVRTTIPKAAQQLQTGVGEAIVLFPDTDYKLKLHEATKGGVYTVIEQIGLGTGMDEYAIGRTLTGTGIAVLAGAALAAWLGSRFDRLWPITIGLGLNVVAMDPVWTLGDGLGPGVAGSMVRA